ncbi:MULTISPECIES: hypothetical protein [unclassified Pseudoalteromonas]|uniref:hypothetical protein n=1 Tax=unclassified Pseudoalteromonas TaxID=194690 RepID=UPI0006E4E864|nr:MULTISPECIES: hypothetical protein [unclassified Pseudoalteromonas]KPZ67443.1 hypothetical protein AN394_03645 [Pseudoalteromonas sp. P1-26]
MYRILLTLMLAGALLGVSNAAIADIESELVTYRIVTEDSEEIREETNAVSPNDVIEYELRYTNVSERPITGLRIVGPIPTETTYIANSASASIMTSLEVSIDGGTSFAAEPLIVTDSSGTQTEISADEYTQIRWNSLVGIQPGETHVFTYRVVVN